MHATIVSIELFLFPEFKCFGANAGRGQRYQRSREEERQCILKPSTNTGLDILTGHSKPATRFVHYIGLFFAPLAGIAASFLVAWWAFLIIIPVCYVAALLTHPLLEHNSNKPFADRPLVERHRLAEDVGARPDRRPAIARFSRLDRRSRTAAMTTAVVVVCTAILALAAAFHFYWGLGGRIGSGVSLPHREDGTVGHREEQRRRGHRRRSGPGRRRVACSCPGRRVPRADAAVLASRRRWRCGRSYSSRAQSAGPDMSACSSAFGTRVSRDTTRWLYSPLCLLLGLGLLLSGWRLPADHDIVTVRRHLRPAARSRSHMARRPPFDFATVPV